MQYSIGCYDDSGYCKVCGEHVSNIHADGCEIGVLRKELHNLQQKSIYSVVVELGKEFVKERPFPYASFIHLDFIQWLRLREKRDL